MEKEGGSFARTRERPGGTQELLQKMPTIPWTESVNNREKGPCSKRFPLDFTERTRSIPLLNIKPATLTDFRLNLTGSRDRNRRHYYFNLKGLYFYTSNRE